MAENEIKKQPEDLVGSTELLGCPFCGDVAWMHSHGSVFNGQMGHRVECEGACHAMTCYWHTKEQAIKAWNTRHPND